MRTVAQNRSGAGRRHVPGTEPLAQPGLDDLAHGVARQFLYDLQSLRQLADVETATASVLAKLREAGRHRGVRRDDDRAHALPGLLVRHTDHGGVRDARMGDEVFLDLPSGDVLHLPDDDVLEPTGGGL